MDIADQNLAFNPNQILPNGPYDSEDPDKQEVIDQTFELYFFHLSRRILDSGLKYPIDPLEKKECNFSQNVIALKTLARRFVMSPQRLRIYEQAQNVDLAALQCNTFEQLLSGIFQDSYGEAPWKRVLGLFYFCSDLSMRTLEENILNSFIVIYNWTNSYLGVKLSAWVKEQGGWSVILQDGSNSISYATLSILGFCCIGVLAICIYIRRK